MTITKLDGDKVAVCPSAMQPTSSASSADLGALNKMPEHLLAIGKKWADYAQADGDNNDIAFAVLSAIQEAAAIVPPVVQAPTEPIDGRWYWVMKQDVDSQWNWHPAQRERNHWNSAKFSGIPLHEVKVGAEIVAAPIVATVPSEHQLWNAACAIRELEFEDVPLPDCMVLIHEILDPYLADPSPTEQASDVRNAALENLCASIMEQVEGNIRQTVRDCVNGFPEDVQDIYIYCDQIESFINNALKSATPADKGNAPAEAITDTDCMNWLCDSDKVYWIRVDTEPNQENVFNSSIVSNLRKVIAAQIAKDQA